MYAYTFATPRTVRGEYPAYANIFNVINPTDYITMLPLPQWGFARYGVDVILPVVGASDRQLSAVQADFAQELGNWGTFQVFKEGDRIPTLRSFRPPFATLPRRGTACLAPAWRSRTRTG